MLLDGVRARLDPNACQRTSGAGQTVIAWVAPGGQTLYTSLAAFTAAKRFEAHGFDFPPASDPFLVDPSTRDDRVRSASAVFTRRPPHFRTMWLPHWA